MMDIFRRVAAQAEPNGPIAMSAKVEARLAQIRDEQKERRGEPTAYTSLQAFAEAVTSPRSHARRIAHEMEHNPAVAELGMSMAKRTHWLKQHVEKWARMATEERERLQSSQQLTGRSQSTSVGARKFSNDEP